MKFFGLSSRAVRRWHDSVEHDGVDDVSGRGDSDALPHGTQCYLVDHRGVEFLDLLDWPGQLVDLFAGLDVPEVPRCRDHFHGRQPVFDDQLTGFMPVGGLVLVRETAGVLGKRQDRTEVVLHGIWHARPECALELIDCAVLS